VDVAGNHRDILYPELDMRERLGDGKVKRVGDGERGF
jgi:hypothetical protein